MSHAAVGAAHFVRSNVIHDTVCASASRAIRAAVDAIGVFHAVSEHSRTTAFAGGRQCMNGALK